MICQKGDKRLMHLAVSIMQNEKRFEKTQNAVFFHWPESRVLDKRSSIGLKQVCESIYTLFIYLMYMNDIQTRTIMLRSLFQVLFDGPRELAGAREPREFPQKRFPCNRTVFMCILLNGALDRALK